ncbi:MAG: hypothetical protein AB7F75_02370 [Planctomycetota bacterium]
MEFNAYRILACCAYALLVAALVVKKKRRPHAILATLAMALDLTLVLVLELNRSVVEGLAEKNYSILQYGHITASTFAVICYFPTFINGFKRLRGLGDASTRRRHILWARAAFAFRTVGLILMFSLKSG